MFKFQIFSWEYNEALGFVYDLSVVILILEEWLDFVDL